MHNDSAGDYDCDDDDDDNNNQDLYICSTYYDKITQHRLHQSLRSTIKVRKSMHSVMYSNVSASSV
jgi:hypothetical protein